MPGARRGQAARVGPGDGDGRDRALELDLQRPQVDRHAAGRSRGREELELGHVVAVDHGAVQVGGNALPVRPLVALLERLDQADPEADRRQRHARDRHRPRQRQQQRARQQVHVGQRRDQVAAHVDVGLEQRVDDQADGRDEGQQRDQQQATVGPPRAHRRHRAGHAGERRQRQHDVGDRPRQVLDPRVGLARQRAQRLAPDRARRELDQERDGAVVAGGERQPHRQGQQRDHERDDDGADPLAPHPARPHGLRHHHERAGVVGEQHRGDQHGQQRPAPEPAAVQGHEQGPGRADHEQGQERVAARLVRVPDQERAQRREAGAHERRRRAHEPPPHGVDDRDQGHAADQRGQPQPQLGVADAAREPDHEEVERRGDLGRAHGVDEVVQGADGRGVVGEQLVPEQALAEPGDAHGQRHQGQDARTDPCHFRAPRHRAADYARLASARPHPCALASGPGPGGASALRGGHPPRALADLPAPVRDRGGGLGHHRLQGPAAQRRGPDAPGGAPDRGGPGPVLRFLVVLPAGPAVSARQPLERARTLAPDLARGARARGRRRGRARLRAGAPRGGAEDVAGDLGRRDTGHGPAPAAPPVPDRPRPGAGEPAAVPAPPGAGRRALRRVRGLAPRVRRLPGRGGDPRPGHTPAARARPPPRGPEVRDLRAAGRRRSVRARGRGGRPEQDLGPPHPLSHHRLRQIPGAAVPAELRRAAEHQLGRRLPLGLVREHAPVLPPACPAGRVGGVADRAAPARAAGGLGLAGRRRVRHRHGPLPDRPPGRVPHGAAGGDGLRARGLGGRPDAAARARPPPAQEGARDHALPARGGGAVPGPGQAGRAAARAPRGPGAAPDAVRWRQRRAPAAAAGVAARAGRRAGPDLRPRRGPGRQEACARGGHGAAAPRGRRRRAGQPALGRPAGAGGALRRRPRASGAPDLRDHAPVRPRDLRRSPVLRARAAQQPDAVRHRRPGGGDLGAGAEPDRARPRADPDAGRGALPVAGHHGAGAQPGGPVHRRDHPRPLPGPGVPPGPAVRLLPDPPAQEPGAAGAPPAPAALAGRFDEDRAEAAAAAGARERARRALELAGLLDDRAQPGLEAADVEAHRVVDASLGRNGVGVEPAHGLGQRLGPARVEERAGLALEHGLERAAFGVGDHRAAGGLGLDGGDPELLGRGHDERPGALEQLGRALVADPALEGDVARGDAAQAASVGAVAHDHQRQAQAGEGLHRHRDPLVRHELRDDQVVVGRRAGPEALGLHRRVEHGGVAVEVARDAARRDVRVGHVAVHALGRDPVPLAPAVEHHRQRRPPEPVAAAQRLVARVPRVAERVVAVADVQRTLVDDHAVRPRARGRDHDVVPAQVERLDRVGVQRQQRPEGLRGRAQPLQERRVDRSMGESTLRPLLVVYRCVDVGIGPDVADGHEDALGTSDVEQEVVNQRDARRRGSSSRHVGGESIH